MLEPIIVEAMPTEKKGEIDKAKADFAKAEKLRI